MVVGFDYGSPGSAGLGRNWCSGVATNCMAAGRVRDCRGGQELGQRGFIVGCGRVAWRQDSSGTPGVVRDLCTGGCWWVVVGFDYGSPGIVGVVRNWGRGGSSWVAPLRQGCMAAGLVRNCTAAGRVRHCWGDQELGQRGFIVGCGRVVVGGWSLRWESSGVVGVIRWLVGGRGF